MTIAELLAAVARHFGLSAAQLRERSRRRHIVQARQAAAWVLREAIPTLSLQSIGDALGGQDHTTIIFSLQAVIARMAADPALAAELRDLAGLPPVPAPRPFDPAMRWWVVQGRRGWEVLAA